GHAQRGLLGLEQQARQQRQRALARNRSQGASDREREIALLDGQFHGVTPSFRKPMRSRDFQPSGAGLRGAPRVNRPMIGTGRNSRKRFPTLMTASKSLLYNKKEASNRRGCRGCRWRHRNPRNRSRFQPLEACPGGVEKRRPFPREFKHGSNRGHFSPLLHGLSTPHPDARV